MSKYLTKTISLVLLVLYLLSFCAVGAQGAESAVIIEDDEKTAVIDGVTFAFLPKSVERVVFPDSITYFSSLGAQNFPQNLKEIVFEGHAYPDITIDFPTSKEITIYYYDWALGFDDERWSAENIHHVVMHGKKAPQPLVDWRNVWGMAVIRFADMDWYVCGRPDWLSYNYNSDIFTLVAKEPVCEKEFDQNGGNDWETSTLRAWLNSTEGFLSDERFSEGERKALRSAEYECILTEETKERAVAGDHVMENIYKHNIPGGRGEYRIFDYNKPVDLNDCYVNEISRKYVSKLTDLVYIPDESNVRLVWKGVGLWLRSPYTANSGEARYVDSDGIYFHALSTEKMGVRPMITIDSSLLEITGGFGTKDDPLTVKPRSPERFEENGLYGYRNADGDIVVKAKYEKALPFSDGAALVVQPGDDKWSYIDSNGKLLFEKSFYASNNFNSGYAVVLVSDEPKKYAYIDKSGEFANGMLFDEAEDFNGGYARVKMDGKWGVVDMKFNFVT